MPHYGKHKRPSELVQAHIREDGSAACGRCGQFLWLIDIDDDRLSPGESSLFPGFAGRRLAGDGVWRLTQRSRTHRRRAETGLSTRTVSDEAAITLRVRLSQNLFRQGAKDARLADTRWRDERYRPARLYAALKLPAKVECARCGDVNVIEVS